MPAVRHTAAKSSPMVLWIIRVSEAPDVILAQPAGEATSDQTARSCRQDPWLRQAGCCHSAASSALKTQRGEGLCTETLCVHSTVRSTSPPAACLTNCANCPVKHTWDWGHATHRGKLQPPSVCPLLQEAVGGVCFE